jgi:hypothetical protein
MATDSSSEKEGVAPGRSWRKWILGAVLLVFFSYLLWFVVNPYRDQPYAEVPHGDHVHYVPKERDEEVPISRFPTRPPEADERITPDGEIVPKNR